jgi:hypothetical protein
MKRADARRWATALAWGRIGIGVASVAAPRAALAPWVGEDDAARPSVRLLARSLGGRDIALGVGTLLAMSHDAPVRGWIEAGALADAADTVGSVLVFRGLPTKTRWLFVAVSGGAVALGRILAPAVD